MTTTSLDNNSTLIAMLKACVDQLKEYSPNEHVIGTETEFSIIDIESEISRLRDNKTA